MLKSLVKEIWRKARGSDGSIDESTSSPYYDPASLVGGMTNKARHLLRNGYLDYPALVHLETQTVCNAACDFCPYPTVARKGTKMSDALIEKVIRDLEDIPSDLAFQFSPYKLSDPFIEPRLFDILATVNARLPNARISLITNGAALTARNLDRLAHVRAVGYMNVSVNTHLAEEYERVMQIPFARTLARLDELHARKRQGKLDLRIRLTRVSGGRATDAAFMAWSRERYPAFEPAIIPRNDWLGEVATPGSATEIPDAPCHRWFDMSITSTGIVAMCCMDGEAKYPKGNVAEEHVLEIYNRPWLRQLREQLLSRRATGAPCDRCTYLSY
jgi:MoaA/NifB/PqqE/SkfB family radical SAM enzyme